MQFTEFKVALRSFEETEKCQQPSASGVTGRVMTAQPTQRTRSSNSACRAAAREYFIPKRHSNRSAHNRPTMVSSLAVNQPLDIFSARCCLGDSGRASTIQCMNLNSLVLKLRGMLCQMWWPLVEWGLGLRL